MELNNDKLKKLKQAFPGRKVTIEGTDVDVMVKPVRLADVMVYQEAVGRALASIEHLLRSLVNGDEQADDDFATALFNAIKQLLCGDLIDIVQAGVDIDLREVPHFILPQIVSAWAEESFGGKKLDGWMDLAKTAMENIGQASTGSTSPTSSEN